MKTRRALKSIMAFGVLIVVLVSCSSATKAANTQQIDITIDTAYYCDLDSDGREDDIYADATFIIEEGWAFIFFDYEFVYPSGNSFEGEFHFTTIESNKVLHFRLYNGATEPGWYIFNIDAKIINNWNYVQVYESLVFDPPGGNEDDPITITIT